SFLATSPPPWNAADNNSSSPNNRSTTGSSAGSALKSGGNGNAEGGGDASSPDVDSLDSPVPSSITVLSTSLPGNSLAKELHRKASLKNTRRDRSTSYSQSQSSPFSGSNGHQPTLSSAHIGGGGSTNGQHHEHGTTAAFHQAAVLGNGGIGGGIPIPTNQTPGSGATYLGPSVGGKNNHSNNHSNNNSMLATATAAQRRIKSRPKWYFGIRSRSAPLEVMAEIYRALSNLSMKWKIINTYHLRAKYEYAEGFEVKIELQLYRLDSDNYLVDFKYVGQHSAAEIQARAELMNRINEETQQQFARHLSSLSAKEPVGENPSINNNTGAVKPIESSTTAVEAEVEAEAEDSVSGKEGSSAAVSNPQDIPQPTTAHGSVVGVAAMDNHLLSHTAPVSRPQPLVSFKPNNEARLVPAVASGSGGSDSSPSGGMLLPSMLSMSLPATTTGPSSSLATGPGILSSSLMQERQYLKEINELQQQLKHQQRQRDMNRRPTHLLFPKASYQLASAKDVTSPFPFFDVCGKLITELAIGSG
ncbi:protein kinase, AMP-activated, alpha 2 catalytic subunit, partial [Lobosporangium transversale]